ncbi:MAG: hypothetical protein WC378_20690 [Opitutaceae bacterium]|jgi:hypothetical protein
MCENEMKALTSCVRWIGSVILVLILSIAAYNLITVAIYTHNGYEQQTIPGCSGAYWVKTSSIR